MNIAGEMKSIECKVLLVDDKDINLALFESILKKVEGIQIITAKSGYECLQKIENHVFAVILLDVEMPTMDGFETARRIRKNESHKETPLVFFTANEQNTLDINQKELLGAVDYIVKPVNRLLFRTKILFFVNLYKKNHELKLTAKEAEVKSQHLEELVKTLEDSSAKLIQAVDGHQKVKQNGHRKSQARI